MDRLGIPFRLAIERNDWPLSTRTHTTTPHGRLLWFEDCFFIVIVLVVVVFVVAFLLRSAEKSVKCGSKIEM